MSNILKVFSVQGIKFTFVGYGCCGDGRIGEVDNNFTVSDDFSRKSSHVDVVGKDD